uniref:Citrate transporter-like domain-containing protein n=1 Tax=Ammonifex degensii TaxID=42838 RepID=A0A7C2I1E7_9THEO
MATLIFLGTYALIVVERLPRAMAAMLGAALVTVSGLLSQEQAVASIDFNTIGLLIGMMVIVAITRRSGVFEYLAVWVAKRSGGEPVRILIALSLLTAVLSALLDNVTTVLFTVPVALVLADRLGVNPFPYLVAQILASNIGGTATLIGDPPNIMISHPAGLNFADFLYNLAPVSVFIMLITLLLLVLLYRRQLQIPPEQREQIMTLKEDEFLKDRALIKPSFTVLALTLVGFGLHGWLHLGTATVALAGATVLVMLVREEPEEIFLAVEWPTLFFFGGLFVVVGALEKTGVIEAVARAGLDLTGGALLPSGLLVLWMAALASTIVDNIPFVATMIPLIQEFGQLGNLPDLNPLWWALALGACLGGNGSLIGAAANIIVAGVAEKYGSPISFWRYFKVGFPLMLVSIVVAMVYLLLFYLR